MPLSICLMFVTLRYCVKKARRIVEIYRLRYIVLFFRTKQCCKIPTGLLKRGSWMVNKYLKTITHVDRHTWLTMLSTFFGWVVLITWASSHLPHIVDAWPGYSGLLLHTEVCVVRRRMSVKRCCWQQTDRRSCGLPCSVCHVNWLALLSCVSRWFCP